MRTLSFALALLAAIPVAAHAGEDPPGTEPITIVLGRAQPIQTAMQGTTAVCDDPTVVSAALTEDGLVLRGLALGTTLCGLRGAAGQQVGLLRVTVVAAPPPRKAPAKRGGSSDDDDDGPSRKGRKGQAGAP